MNTKNKYKILLVDDEISIVNAISRIIDRDRYDIVCTTEPEKAFAILQNGDIDILLCDQRMPKVSGIDIINFAKSISPETVRILITGYSDMDIVALAINEGKIFYYITKPWNNKDLLDKLDKAITWKNEQAEREKRLKELSADRLNWEYTVDSLERKLNESTQQAVNSLLKVIKARDEELYFHSERTSRYSLIIADAVGMSQGRKMDLKYASLVHDIGKIAVRDRITYKPGCLNADEVKEMKQHPDVGAEIIKELGAFKSIAEIIRQHHEWIDGTGYPHKLKGEEILHEARILSIADVFDALTSDRIYRKGMSKEQALDIMKNERGTHFDSYILDVFMKRVEKE